MNPTVLRIVKAAVGTIVLIALLVTVNRWWAEYQDRSAPAKPATKVEESASKGEEQTPAAPESEAQPPTETKTEAPAKTRVVVVKTDGLNFRKEPSQDANVIRGLDKGEKLTYLREDGGWFQVQDSEGVKGWISSKSQYAELQ